MHDIQPIKVRDLPRFLKAIEPMAAELAAGDISGALIRNIDAVIEATAIGAGVRARLAGGSDAGRAGGSCGEGAGGERGFFRPAGAAGDPGRGGSSHAIRANRVWWHEWIAALVDAGFAYRDVMDMAWTDARDFHHGGADDAPSASAGYGGGRARGAGGEARLGAVGEGGQRMMISLSGAASASIHATSAPYPVHPSSRPTAKTRSSPRQSWPRKRAMSDGRMAQTMTYRETMPSTAFM
jgi:hypothetical protein